VSHSKFETEMSLTTPWCLDPGWNPWCRYLLCLLMAIDSHTARAVCW